jgi:nicotinate-nucleotide adenylyltransferase
LRLGVYGGAFDPPHNAHLALARAAVAQLRLDELRIFPTGHAYHRGGTISPAPDRLAMARLAFGGLAKTTVDDRETRRPGPTYTVDTLRELRAELGEPQLFLVIGEDQARAFTSWHEWAEIARMATLCVAHRGSSSADVAVPEAAIVTLELPPMPESATDIRARAGRGEAIASLVPPAVAGYIAAHHLYRGN